jgi:multiple sugar transport system substrate-binding protein
MVQTLQKFKNWRDQIAWQPLLVMMLVFLVLGSLCGCVKKPDGKVHIQLSSWGSAQEVSVLKSLLKEFEATHPQVQVELLHIPENYYQKLQLLVAGDLTPDVIFTNSISFPVYASQGIFMDLRPLLAKQAAGVEGLSLSTKYFYPAALQAFTWKTAEGKEILGALPRDVSNVAIFYNRELFQRAGIPEPSANWTWAQFLETAKKLTLDTNNDGDPDQFGISFYSKPPLFWLPFVWSAGGDLFSPDLRQVTLNSPAAIKGLQFYADLRNQWHVAPKKVESGGVTMSQLFLQQKLAMMVNGRWSVPVLREQAKFQWDVAPLPVGPGGKSRVGIDASGYAISAKTPHPQACFELVRFLLSQKAIAAVTESSLIVPARRDVAESALFLAPGQAPAHGRVFLDSIPDGVPTRTPPRWNELVEELGLALEPVWDGQQDAASAVKSVKPKLQHLLEVSP